MNLIPCLKFHRQKNGRSCCCAALLHCGLLDFPSFCIFFSFLLLSNLPPRPGRRLSTFHSPPSCRNQGHCMSCIFYTISLSLLSDQTSDQCVLACGLQLLQSYLYIRLLCNVEFELGGIGNCEWESN
jgi:hypothetical protein